jgi:plasmid stabilization system protein ParE
VKPFQLSDPATTELTHAIRWYEQQRAGLGGELFDAVTETIDLIRTHPEIGESRLTRRPSRQLRVNRFPYNVVYRIRDDDS